MNRYIEYNLWCLKIAYVIVIASVLYKVFGFPPPWHVYIFWTGVIIVGLVSLAISITCIMVDSSGCTGDCNQGRQSCNCKDVL